MPDGDEFDHSKRRSDFVQGRTHLPPDPWSADPAEREAHDTLNNPSYRGNLASHVIYGSPYDANSSPPRNSANGLAGGVSSSARMWAANYWAELRATELREHALNAQARAGAAPVVKNYVESHCRLVDHYRSTMPGYGPMPSEWREDFLDKVLRGDLSEVGRRLELLRQHSRHSSGSAELERDFQRASVELQAYRQEQENENLLLQEARRRRRRIVLFGAVVILIAVFAWMRL